MHALKPNTRYVLATITVAIPLDAPGLEPCPNDDAGAEACFIINSALDAAIVGLGENSVFADWKIENSGIVCMTGADPQEGELFK